MKALLLNFLLLSVFASSFAQSKGTLTYKLSIKTSFGDNEVNKIIYFDGHQSMEYFIPKNISSSSQQRSETEYVETRVIKITKQPFLLKNLKEKK